MGELRETFEYLTEVMDGDVASGRVLPVSKAKPKDRTSLAAARAVAAVKVAAGR